MANTRYGYNPQHDEPEDDEYLDGDNLSAEESRLGYKVVALSKGASRPVNERKNDDGRIFTERDDRHPGGEVVVVRGRAVKVYPTARVMSAIGDGLLIEVFGEPTPLPPNVADVLDEQRAQQAALQSAQQSATPPAAPTPPQAPQAPKTPATPKAGAAVRRSSGGGTR